MRSPFGTRLLGSRRTPATAPKAEALRKSGPSGRDRSHWDNSARASSTSRAPSSFPPWRRSDLQAVGPASPTFLTAVWRARRGSQPGNGSKRDCPGPAGATRCQAGGARGRSALPAFPPKAGLLAVRLARTRCRRLCFYSVL